MGRQERGLRLLQGVKLEKEGLKIRDMVLGSDDWPTPSTVEVEQRVCNQHSLSNMCDNRKIERREKGTIYSLSSIGGQKTYQIKSKGDSNDAYHFSQDGKNEGWTKAWLDNSPAADWW